MSCLAGLNPALHGAVAPRTSARMTSSSRKSLAPPRAAFGGGAPRAFAGAGIVAGSDPGAEATETEMKLRTILEALI